MSTTWDSNKRSVLVRLQSEITNSPCRNKPSTESLESTVRLSSKRRLFSLTFYCVITISVSPHQHSNPTRRDPIPAVLPWMLSPLPRFPRGYRGIPAIHITVQTVTLHLSTGCCQTKTDRMLTYEAHVGVMLRGFDIWSFSMHPLYVWWTRHIYLG